MSDFFVVSTPIGNLGDVTHRALQVLGEVDRILAEDTRHTRKLLARYRIATPLVSLHAHNEAARAERVLSWLDAGEGLALVSDAGTPLLSDPGARLVQTVVRAGHRVVPVPGASALLAALVGSGLEPEPFTFLGFFPRTGKARSERLAQLASLRHTGVIFEAPGRLSKLLRDVEAACGPERFVVVARELTKVHETFIRGTAAELARRFELETVRGEVVVVLEGCGDREEDPSDTDRIRRLAVDLLSQGLPPSAVARELSRRLRVPRNRAYRISLEEAERAEG